MTESLRPRQQGEVMRIYRLAREAGRHSELYHKLPLVEQRAFRGRIVKIIVKQLPQYEGASLRYADIDKILAPASEEFQAYGRYLQLTYNLHHSAESPFQRAATTTLNMFAKGVTTVSQLKAMQNKQRRQSNGFSRDQGATRSYRIGFHSGSDS